MDTTTCAWDGNTEDVQLVGNEPLCAGCRATIARAEILSAVSE